MTYISEGSKFFLYFFKNKFYLSVSCIFFPDNSIQNDFQFSFKLKVYSFLKLHICFQDKLKVVYK